MAPHSSTLAWKIPWTEEPGGLQSTGSLRVGDDWATSLSRIGEGDGNPLQCSCLENPRDGGAWWAVVHGVTQNLTRLKRLSSSSGICNIHTYNIYWIQIGCILLYIDTTFSVFFLLLLLFYRHCFYILNSLIFSGSQSKSKFLAHADSTWLKIIWIVMSLISVSHCALLKNSNHLSVFHPFFYLWHIPEGLTYSRCPLKSSWKSDWVSARRKQWNVAFEWILTRT